jgi:hypothetical protein
LAKIRHVFGDTILYGEVLMILISRYIKYSQWFFQAGVNSLH